MSISFDFMWVQACLGLLLVLSFICSLNVYGLEYVYGVEDCDDDDASCIRKQMGSSLVQRGLSSTAKVEVSEADSEVKVTGVLTQYPGCNSFMTKCSPTPGSEVQAWSGSSWDEWKMGFDTCCHMIGHAVMVCEGISAELFDFIGSTVNPGDKVKDGSPDFLDGFCNELGGLVDLHLMHKHMGPQGMSLLQGFSDTFGLSERLRDVHALKGCMGHPVCQRALTQVLANDKRTHDNCLDCKQDCGHCSCGITCTERQYKVRCGCHAMCHGDGRPCDDDGAIRVAGHPALLMGLVSIVLPSLKILV